MKINRKYVIISIIICGLFVLMFVCYSCIKAGIQKQLETIISRLNITSTVNVDIYSDMFSITAGKIRKVRITAVPKDGNGYCNIELKSLKLNLKDKSKNSIGSADFNVRMSEHNLAVLLTDHFKQPIQMQNGYVFFTKDNNTVTGTLHASGNMVLLHITGSSYTADTKTLEEKINPIFVDPKTNIKEFVFKDGYYTISGTQVHPEIK